MQTSKQKAEEIGKRIVVCVPFGSFSNNFFYSLLTLIRYNYLSHIKRKSKLQYGVGKYVVLHDAFYYLSQYVVLKSVSLKIGHPLMLRFELFLSSNKYQLSNRHQTDKYFYIILKKSNESFFKRQFLRKFLLMQA